MAKKEKMVELKPKADKITEEQLQRLQKTVSEINKTQMEIGRIEVQKHNVVHQISVIQDQIVLFRDKLKKSYGTDDIDIQNGVINYKKDEQTDKKD